MTWTCRKLNALPLPVLKVCSCYTKYSRSNTIWYLSLSSQNSPCVLAMLYKLYACAQSVVRDVSLHQVGHENLA